MVRRFWFCIVLVFLSLPVVAVEAVVSFNVFYIPQQSGAAKPYIELYWQINPLTLQMQQTDGAWKGIMENHIVLSNASGVIKEDRYLSETIPQPTRQQTFSLNILNLRRYEVPAGNINITLTITDQQGKSQAFIYKDSVMVDTPQLKTAYYSGLQIIDTSYISQENKSSIYYKNDRVQIPLSTNFLDDDRALMHYYTELYQSDMVSKDEWPLVQRIYISRKPMDAVIYGLEQQDTLKPAAVLPFLGKFDLRALPSGNYYLNVILMTQRNTVLAKRNYFFQRINKNPLKNETSVNQDTGFQKVNVFDMSKTFVGKYNISQLRSILLMVKPIATANEINSIEGFLDRPDEMYMRYFILNFWKSRNDQDPKKAWDEFSEKVKEVNKLFQGAGKPGYQTERGQVYLKYGKPNERIIVLNEQGALPYEIWQYNAPGKQSSQGILLFYRPGFMINDFALLHSTVQGEVRNTKWRSLLYTSQMGAGSNARAEQYFPLN